MTPDPINVSVSPSSAGSRRVLIVDDHALTLAAVEALLERECPRIEVVATASDAATALRLIGTAAPDVVVLDLNLGDTCGLDLMPAISRHPGIAVVILTSSDDPLQRTRALASGAAAFVNKLAPAAELIAAILSAFPGRAR